MEKLAAEAIKLGAVQKLDELTSFLEALPKLDTVVEIGCDAGGMLWLWKQLARNVYGVTLNGGPFATGHRLQTHGAKIVIGDSHDAVVRTRLDALLPKDSKVDLLFIDGDHTYMGVLKDWVDYGSWSKMVAFHDIVPHEGLPEVGVHELWAGLTGDKQEFVRPGSKDGGIGLIKNWS